MLFADGTWIEATSQTLIGILGGGVLTAIVAKVIDYLKDKKRSEVLRENEGLKTERADQREEWRKIGEARDSYNKRLLAEYADNTKKTDDLLAKFITAKEDASELRAVVKLQAEKIAEQAATITCQEETIESFRHRKKPGER